MIIRSKFESNSHERNRLSINASKPNLLKSNLKIPKNHQQKDKQSIIKSLITKNKQKGETPDKHQNREFPSVQKQNIRGKRSASFIKKQLDAEEKPKAGRTLKLQRTSKMDSILFNLPLLDQNFQNREQRNVKVENKQKIIKNRLVISNLMSNQLYSSGNKSENQNQSEEQGVSFYQSKEKISLGGSFGPFHQNKKRSRYSTFPQKPENTQISNFNQLVQSRLFESRKSQRLYLDKCTLEVIIKPFKNHVMVNVQIQTIQQEKEFFQYLRYKRRKQEYQNQLLTIFGHLTSIRQQRQVYEERVSRLLNCDNKSPSNEREERVFNLKNEIIKQEKHVEKTIYEKYHSFQNYMNEFQSLQTAIASENDNFLKSILKYESTLTSGLTQIQTEKIKNNIATLQKVIKLYFKENQKKVIKQLEKGKLFKEEATQLIEAFKEYIKSTQQQKGLLKNCFGQIKKIPELCYGLLGDQLPDLKTKARLKNSNDEFEMPKCMDCFNSEWKLHMIIEKNQLMQSIFKVTEELFN